MKLSVLEGQFTLVQNKIKNQNLNNQQQIDSIKGDIATNLEYLKKTDTDYQELKVKFLEDEI